jgi:hypothetical protein
MQIKLASIVKKDRTNLAGMQIFTSVYKTLNSKTSKDKGIQNYKFTFANTTVQRLGKKP